MTERKNRETVAFDANVPVEIRLRFADGKVVNGMYSDRMMYTTVDDRVFFLDPDVARQIPELKIQPGEPFLICKQRGTGKGRPIYWKIWRAPAEESATVAEESSIERDLRHSLSMKSPHGVLVVEKDKPQAAAPAPATPPPARPATPPPMPHANGNGVAKLPPTKATYGAAMAEFLLIAGRATRDVEVKLGAEGGSVRFDSRDVAALATTMMIQAAREGWIVWKPGECA